MEQGIEERREGRREKEGREEDGNIPNFAHNGAVYKIACQMHIIVSLLPHFDISHSIGKA